MQYIVKSQKDFSIVCFCGTNGAAGACRDRTRNA